LVRNLEGRRLLEGPKHRWEDNISVDLREIGWDGVDWIHLAEDRDQRWALKNMVRNPLKGWEFVD
jgi:hypothetical protein